MRIPDKYRPAVFVSAGAIMIYISIGFLKYIGGTLFYFMITGDAKPLGSTILLMVTSWAIGWIEVYHGFALIRHSKAAKKYYHNWLS